LAEISFHKKQLNKARKGYISAIKLCPNFELAWDKLLSLELENNIVEVKPLLLSAMVHLPESKMLQTKQSQLEKLLAKTKK